MFSGMETSVTFSCYLCKRITSEKPCTMLYIDKFCVNNVRFPELFDFFVHTKLKSFITLCDVIATVLDSNCVQKIFFLAK